MVKECKKYAIGWFLVGVVYSDNHDAFMRDFLGDIQTLQKFVEYVTTLNILDRQPEEPDLIKDIIENTFQCFIRGISKFKHQGFHEENEVRAVIFRHAANDRGLANKEIHYRESDGYHIPYIKLFEGQKLPIEKIIVGPHKDKEKRAAALRDKLKSIGLGNVEVTVSNIPYIGNK